MTLGRTLFKVSVLLIALWGWAALVWAAPAWAAEAKPDMRVVIDISGSMKKTDPENLRIPASKLLLNLAQENTQFGVWTFGQYVNMLVPHKPVEPAWRENALNQVELINSVALYTNIGEALEKASLNQLEPDPEWDRTIVLLSDGMVDISKTPAVNQKEQERILSELVPRLKKAGFKIHSVALSEAADTDFLKQIALDTNGNFTLARTADDLMSVFVQASDQVNKPEQVPLDGNQFKIDAAVQEFTALIFRKPGSSPTLVYTPGGQTLSVRKKPNNVSWFSDSRYDLITVRNPQPGSWRVKADMDPDNRVTVVTDLSLMVSGLPENLIEGEKVTMTTHLSEKGAPVSDSNFLSLMDITFSQETSKGERFAGKLSHDKQGKPKIPEQGVYSAKLGRTLTEGEHLFEVFVDGKTFQRKRTQRVTVHRDVLNVDQGVGQVNGEEHKFLLVKPKAALIDPEQINLLAQIKGPSDEKVIQDAVINDEGQWQIDVPKFERAGIYDVLVKVSGVSANGLPFEIIQGPYEIDYTPVGLNALPDLDSMAEEFQEETLDIPELDESIDEPEVIEEPEETVAETPPELLIEDTRVVEEAVDSAADPVAAVPDEEGLNPLVLVGAVVLGNLLLIGGGWFIYRKMVSKEQAQREEVEEEITRLQRQRTEAKTQPQPVVAPQEVAEPETGSDFFDDEATTIKTETVDDEHTVAQPTPPAAAAPPPEPIPEEENQAYVNQAAPLEIEDDELIEVDDFDDFDEEGIGDLDDMLSEQEQSSASAYDNSDAEDGSGEASSGDRSAEGNDEESDEEKFAKDEFMLDDPDQK
ncbi:MAG: VWA domain-containing protein [Pseudomonadales bacterium]|nr:VWA domain-containing protein [Pseudomonadales bacterium]